jgi:hypothetical protein
LRGSVHTVTEKLEALVVTTEEIGLKGNSGKYKYMVMYRDKNAGRSDSLKTDIITIERMEKLKCLETTSTDQNSIPEEIKSRLKLWNCCYQ